MDGSVVVVALDDAMSADECMDRWVDQLSMVLLLSYQTDCILTITIYLSFTHPLTNLSSIYLSSSPPTYIYLFTHTYTQDLICTTVESPNRAHHDFFYQLLVYLNTTSSSSTAVKEMMLLSVDDLQSSVYKFLSVLDDLIIDAPLAVSCTA